MKEIDTSNVQLVAILTSLFFFLLILYLIKKKRIKEEYSLLWIFFAIVFILFSFWRRGLDYIAEFIGVAYPPAALFLILLMAVFLILIEFSIIISRLSDKNKVLAQEIALLRLEIRKLKKKKKVKKQEESTTGDQVTKEP